MLTIEVGNEDFTELTKAYMSVFHSKKFNQFLNTSQSGMAHSSSGIGPIVLLKTLLTSLCLCSFQLILFCLFRTTFKFLYQPRTYCVPKNERMEPLPRGFFNWILPIFKYNINYYLSMGLDTYFFIRYINILLLFFLFIGSLNIIILVPINFTGSSEYYSAEGLDKLSLSNISTQKVRRLNFHFIMGLLTIGFLNWIIYYEFLSFVKIRLAYLLSDMHRKSIISRTVLFTDVPEHLKEEKLLSNIFNQLPGGVKNVWFLYDYIEASNTVNEIREILDFLEESQIQYTKKYLKKYLKNICNNSEVLNSNLYIIQNDSSLYEFFYPPVYFGIFKIPFLERYFRIKIPGLFRLLIFQKKVLQSEWSMKELLKRLEYIDKKKFVLAEGKVRKFNKVFIEFNTHNGANIAYQCILSSSHTIFDNSFIEVHPDDIIWENVAKDNNTTSLIEKSLINIILVAIILLYVIPVSFIGLLSRLPLLIEYMPYLLWVLSLPERLQNMIASVLPPLLLAVLTQMVVVVFRYLTYFKGALTGCELELSLQRWYFAFLFIQQFLVVTILSSLTVIFKHIVDQPTSIPILLAVNLPKAAIFFFQYLALKAFAFCGNNFLRVDKLLSFYLIDILCDKTPRQKFRRLTTLLKINWGTIYPVYSVYASIGIAYSIISPLISVFIIFMLILVLLYYKYALKYIYSHINVSETQGRLYPVALLHLYPGIYCLEFCLMGIFVLLKDVDGNFPMRIHGFFMGFVTILTIFMHLVVYNKFYKRSIYLPILNLSPSAKLNDCSGDPQKIPLQKSFELPNEFYLNENLLYLHPALKHEAPKIWLPEDAMGISKLQIKHIENNTKLKSGSTNGAYIQAGYFKNLFNINISRAPPDFK